MPREIQEPVDVTDDFDRQRGGRTYDHPAWGQIIVSKVQGRTELYGSDFEHQNFVSISIHKSQLRRDLSHDWHFSKNELIEVWLSEAQRAHMVSSFGVGEGTCCTISHLDGKVMPRFPLRDEGQIFKPEADKRLDDTVNELRELERKLTEDTFNLPKSKREHLLAPVRRAIEQLESNLAFVSRSFGEHLEKRKEKAKIEITAWMNNAVRRAGMQAIAEQIGTPLHIEPPKERPNHDEKSGTN